MIVNDRVKAMFDLYQKKVLERRMAMKEAYALLYLEAYLKNHPDQKVEELVLCETCEPATGIYKWWLEPKSVNDKRERMVMPWESPTKPSPTG